MISRCGWVNSVTQISRVWTGFGADIASMKEKTAKTRSESAFPNQHQILSIHPPDSAIRPQRIGEAALAAAHLSYQTTQTK